MSEAAGAGEAGVAEDASGALPGVQLEPDHQLLLSCQRRLLQTFILCSGELEADINVPCAGFPCANVVQFQWFRFPAESLH